MERLQQRNVMVFLISGGFRCIVEHVATQLGIPLDHVYANRLKFYFSGKKNTALSDTVINLHWTASL